jgi:hypothetical protein
MNWLDLRYNQHEYLLNKLLGFQLQDCKSQCEHFILEGKVQVVVVVAFLPIHT